MSKNKKCIGCGVILQDENITQEGYVSSLENNLCQRCFRMKNYGEYQVTTKSNEEYIEILKSVGKTKDLVLHIVDLLNIDRDINQIRNYIPNKMILVLNKRDVLPKSISDEKIVEYFHLMNLRYEDIVVISVNKNYQIDTLLNKINKWKTSHRVYVVGHTNTGKSSLINKLIQNYSENTGDLTISLLPSTTLNKIEIKLNEQLTLIDTPGLVDRGSLINYIDTSLLKKLSPKKEIKPKTYQLKKNQCLLIGNFARIDYIEGEKNSFTVFVSNDIKVRRVSNKQTSLKDLAKVTYEIKYHEDLVINGLGWVKIVDKGTIDLYLHRDVESFTRKSLV